MSLEEAKFCIVSTVIQCHSYFSFSKIDNFAFSGKYTSKTIHHQKNDIMTFHKKNTWKWYGMEGNLILYQIF